MSTRIHILDGTPPVEVALKRSKRARRFTLRVSRMGGAVSLSMPQGAPEGEALAFLAERADWVRRNLAEAVAPTHPEIGANFPLLGQMRRIAPAAGRAARFEAGQLFLPEGARGGPALACLLKSMARDALTGRAEHHAARLDRRIGRITLRDTRTRWGSCSSRGDLMFCWRLIMAPSEVLDYVAAHEVAHLVEMNHSPAFWALCARLCPGHDAQRRWLKKNGASLQAWRFDGLP